MDERILKKTPRDLLRVIFRRRKLFLLSSSLAATMVLVLAHYWTLMYTGTAIFERRSDTVTTDAPRGARGSPFGDQKLKVVHNLKGYKAVERAVESLGLTRDLPRGPEGELTRKGKMEKEALIQALMEDITVDWKAESRSMDLISVSFVDEDRWLAEELPNALVRDYINRIGDEIREQLRESHQFLKERADFAKNHLEASMQERIEFESKHADMMPERPDALAVEIRRITGEIDGLRRQQRVAGQTLSRLKETVKTTTMPTTRPVQEIWGPNPDKKKLQEDLAKAQEALAAALKLAHMKEKHPMVQTLRAKISMLEEKIKNTPSEAVIQKVYGTVSTQNDKVLAGQIAAARAELEMTAGELRKLQARLDKANELMANFAPVRQEYLRLTNREKELQQELDDWQGRLAGVQMSLAAEVAKRGTHLNAVEVARQQFRPSSPTLFKVIGIAIASALIFGVGLVLLANWLDRSISTSDEAVRYFGIPVHGVIDEIVTPREQFTRRLRQWTVLPAVSLVLLAALMVSGGSMYLRLQRPELFDRWRTDPANFVSNIRTIIQEQDRRL